MFHWGSASGAADDEDRAAILEFGEVAGEVQHQPRRLNMPRGSVLLAAWVVGMVAVGFICSDVRPRVRSAAVAEIQVKASEEDAEVSTNTDEEASEEAAEVSTNTDEKAAATPSPEAQALAKAQEQAAAMSKQADDVLAKAKQHSKDTIAAAQKKGDAIVATENKSSQDVLAKAAAMEQAALEKAASTDRSCVEVVGTKITGKQELHYKAIAMNPVVATAEKCEFWCKAHAECQLSVFSAETEAPICQWFAELTEEPTAFGDSFNSSYCGGKDDVDDLVKKLKKVFTHKPWLPPTPNCAWEGEDCTESSCCANTCEANYDFSECNEYTCHKKDDTYATCEKADPYNPYVAPEGWDGTELGGHTSVEVAKAKDGVLTQGTRLFCVSFVNWGDEAVAETVNGWKDQGLSILQCDEHAFFDGDASWQTVTGDGRWKTTDWTVKVDPETVFFPERLQWHLDALKTPMGSRVYIKNTYIKFQFLGGLQVLSRDAVALFLEKSSQCDEHLDRKVGDDYWMYQCLEGIGVNSQSDDQLLHDKEAEQPDCYDDWAAAFHPYSGSNDWNKCHSDSQEKFDKKHAGPEEATE